MRLKRLSLKGFKSFADETDIHFNENLIGIVGPNGSGKSNVVDAIRWVLGEGKKSELRLADMKDVIFSGAKERKEGRAARVTLTFDNTKNILSTEYSEVSITRILYRDGGSEYRLNNVPCRRRDITDLFVDSGIGSNSYAIISLNMVEDILHDNGGSRRMMIEQAAGIAKYKIRKKETLRKLQATLEDLARVQDLLFEIEKSMQSFERQAKRTERFNRLKEEYKELAIKVSHIEVKEYSIKLKEIEKQLSEEQDIRLSLNTDMQQDEAVLQQMKTDILEHEKSLNHDQQQFNQLIERLGKVENDKNLVQQSLTNTKDRLIELEKTLEDILKTKEHSEEELQSANELQNTMLEQLENEEARFREAEQHYNLVTEHYNTLRARERELQNEQQSRQEQREALAREVEGLQTRWQIAQANIAQILLRIKTIEETKGQNDQDLRNAQSAFEQAEEKALHCEVEINEQESRLSQMTEDLSAFMTSHNGTLSELNSLEQRVQFLKDIIENHEGLPESVKHLLKLEKNIPIFSDIVNIKDERYSNIVELFLEPFFHYLIAENENEAHSYYEIVRGAQMGKIHAFIIDQLPESGPDDTIKDLISLRSMIVTNEEYSGILDFVCRDVYVSEVPYAVFSVDQLPRRNLTILFPDDFAILSQGVFHGGSNTLFEGVQLGRKKILEDLLEKTQVLRLQEQEEKEQLSALKLEIQERQKALSVKRNELSNLRRAQEAQQRELFQVENKYNNQLETFKQLGVEKKAKEEELSSLLQQVEERQSYYDQLNLQIKEEDGSSTLSAELESAFVKYNETGLQKDEAQRILFEVKGRKSITDRDVEYHINTLATIQQRIEQVHSEKEHHSQAVTDYQDKLDFSKKQLEKLYAEKRELHQKLNSYEDTYYKEKGKIFELEKKISDLRNKISRKDHIVSGLSEKNSNLRYEIKAIHERNSIEFGIEIDPLAFPEEYENQDLELLKEKRNKLNNRIRNYGDINPMAITAYNEIKERHDHISQERDDILEAKDSLEETIAEIESTASERFNRSLDDIRINFRKVFQSLFSADDDCDIVLLNTDDPLEAKIEIVAKPKGKRPKSISQLSGGEKTLTAASFLFALYLLKPAPFCIFDEVDAPLDDVNVRKFNKIIREFSDQSQFIVVTHNKLTMAEVDVLYGVYLKEQGVSGLSAVDFRNYEAAEMLATVEN